MNITLNGQTHQTDAADVGTLVADITGGSTGIAVAVNGQVVPASDWSRPLVDDDRVDILTAVQGG